jgi:hypothetical protein
MADETQLDWYHKAFPDGEHTPLAMDPSVALATLQDYSRLELFMCLRRGACACSGACLCDSDEYWPVSGLKVEMGSNCKAWLEFSLPEQVKPSKKMTWRVFALDAADDAERPLADIGRAALHVLGKMEFPRARRTCKDGRVSVQFDYM